MPQFTLILDNIRSNYNVGAILRTCDAAGISLIYACGTTPYPRQIDDQRDPVVASSNSRQIAKTALGAEDSVRVIYATRTTDVISDMKAKGFSIYGLEQSPASQNVMSFRPKLPCALIVGNEVDGLPEAVLEVCDAVLEIPQHGSKESLNVSVATGIAIYQLSRP